MKSVEIKEELFDNVAIEDNGTIGIRLHNTPICGYGSTGHVVIWADGRYYQSGTATQEQFNEIVRARQLLMEEA